MEQRTLHTMTLDQLISLKNEAVALLDEARREASILRFKLANLDESIKNLMVREREIVRDIIEVASGDDHKEALEALDHGIRD